MLRDRYYIGEIVYKGETYPGRHEPLIDEGLFDHVQGILETRSVAGGTTARAQSLPQRQYLVRTLSP